MGVFKGDSETGRIIYMILLDFLILSLLCIFFIWFQCPEKYNTTDIQLGTHLNKTNVLALRQN